jgi:Anti-sigma-K factor rskA
MTQSLSEEAKHLAAGYVLGELDLEEEQQFRQLLRGNAELVQEVRALSAVFRLLPQELDKIAPPATLQAQILAAHAEAAIAAHEEPRPALERLPQRPQRVRPRNLWPMIATSVAGLAVLGLGLDNWTLRQQLASNTRADAEAIAALLQRPNTRLVGFNTTDTLPAGTVLFTPGQWDEVIVSLNNLPAPESGQIYRMWLELQDGAVIPCGEFSPAADGVVLARLAPLQKPTPNNKAARVFVTAEFVSSPLQPQTESILSVSL